VSFLQTRNAEKFKVRDVSVINCWNLFFVPREGTDKSGITWTWERW